MFGLKETIDTLSDDDFGALRQIVYDNFNPSRIPPISKRPEWYLRFESAYAFNAMRLFQNAIQSDNRFRILLSTARVARKRQEWFDMYTKTFPYGTHED